MGGVTSEYTMGERAVVVSGVRGWEPNTVN